ncbi:hypothetical protein LHP98_04920 [Rhodobacter sp. Har01]|uniref:hypothetical protein n=1 Tax=Rhodobacter sp. Har01 TaxID=2883999 RepID=UPI001D0876DB|nr:hypothetical protein [Rhodobacter sp. Har01]MCB6177472.1 hypothetical protein [Rhodobacter sp. Har01]
MSRPLTLAAVLLALAPTLPAQADSLGLTWATISAGVDGDEQPFASLSGDWKIGSAHGLQFGLGFADRPDGALLSVDAHLYLMPKPGRKYGFYASVADIDGRSVTTVEGGVAGMLALGDRTVVQARAGAGMSNADLDWLTVSAGLSHDVSDRLRIYGGVMLTEFDETAFRALAHEVRAGVRYRVAGATQVTLAVVQDGLSGRNGAPSDTRLELGVSWTFGGSGSGDPVADHAFDTPQPVDVLFRRGLF